jgi:hypothetical protein
MKEELGKTREQGERQGSAVGGRPFLLPIQHSVWPQGLEGVELVILSRSERPHEWHLGGSSEVQQELCLGQSQSTVTHTPGHLSFLISPRASQSARD